MIEIVLLAILALSIVGGYVLSARGREALSRLRPETRVKFSRSEPADEGASITEGEPPTPGSQPRQAA